MSWLTYEAITEPIAAVLFYLAVFVMVAVVVIYVALCVHERWFKTDPLIQRLGQQVDPYPRPTIREVPAPYDQDGAA